MNNIYLNKTQIEKLQKLHVNLVYLFGSYAEGKEHDFSDLDIGIVFFYNVLHSNLSNTYNELYYIFTDVLPNKSIDIVFIQRAGLELCFDVISHGKIIYESSTTARLDFEEKIMIMYADFKPILNEFNAAILNRIQ
jgi:predicted nucleotidyltransferase